MATLSVKPELQNLAKVRLEAHSRKTGAKSAATPAPPAATAPAARQDLPVRPAEWRVTLDLAPENRGTARAQLAEAIAAAERVPLEPEATRGLRLALAIAQAAPSWPVCWLKKEFVKAGRVDLANALHHSVNGLRAARFIDVFAKSIELFTPADPGSE